MKKILLSAAIVALSTLNAFSQDSDKERKFSVTAGVNYAMRIANNPDGLSPQLEEYANDLKKGVSFDISGYYNFNEHIGIGGKFNMFSSSNSLSDQYVVAPNGEVGISDVSDKIQIMFVGPMVITNFGGSQSKHRGYAEAGLGYMSYRNNTFVIDNYTIKGSTLGFAMGASYQYQFTEHFSVGPKISLLSGAISTLNITGPNGYSDSLTLEDDNRESLVRLDLGASAVFRF